MSGLQMAALRPVQEQNGFSTDGEATSLTHSKEGNYLSF
ncbi:hypothetical protein PJE062_4117 [Pseudovibrio sp. JE062]|nr:hypothetical protein PJE062_4117 [Pseudovibrio sp. JE062]